MVDLVLDKFTKEYAYDLIVSIWGNDATLYAEDFFVTERMLHKYENRIIKNLDHIVGKDIVSIGSHSSWLEVLSLLHGANSVTCIEPRKKFANGIKKFATKHKLNLTSVCNIHTSVFDIGKTFDTVFSFNSLGLSHDWMIFLSKLHSVADKLIVVKGLSDVADDSVKLVTMVNANHWGGINISHHSKTDYDNKDYATIQIESAMNKKEKKFVNFKIGKKFFTNLCEFFGYKILDVWQDELKTLPCTATKEQKDTFYQGDQYFVVDMN